MFEGIRRCRNKKYLVDFYFDDIADSLLIDPFEMDYSKEFSPILPRDPFGMETSLEATFEVIIGNLEPLSLKIEVDECDNGLKNASRDDSFFAELNIVWTTDSMIDTENIVDDSWCFGCEKYEIESNRDGTLNAYGFVADNNDEDSSLECCESDSMINTDTRLEIVEDSTSFDGGAATDSIIFVLRYLNLGVKDLLTFEMVCKSLRDAVRKDPYLWTKIHIDHPLSHKISNDDLLRLTDRAQGRLCSLGLIECFKITDDGLQRVLKRNLELTKLSVAGYMKLSLEGVLKILKDFNSVAKPGIKRLRIGDIRRLRISDIRNEHLKELKALLGADENAKASNYKPRFYGEENIYLSLDDERVIDIETCPKCEMLKQVYDCPAEDSPHSCRACIDCIARCIQCGCCLNDKPYEELFSFESQCSDCDRLRLVSYHVFLYS